jgi:hypothetical protein
LNSGRLASAFIQFCANNAFEFDMAVETLESYKLFDQITVQLMQSGDGPVQSELSNLLISV